MTSPTCQDCRVVKCAGHDAGARWMADTEGIAVYARVELCPLHANAARMREALERISTKYDFGDYLPEDHPIVAVRELLEEPHAASDKANPPWPYK